MPPQFYLLGDLRIIDGEQVLPTQPYRVQNLLAYLLLRPQAARREQLIDALYPAASPAQGRRYLSGTLYQLPPGAAWRSYRLRSGACLS